MPVMLAEQGRNTVDLRWRIVYQRIGMHFAFERNLNIALSTAYRVYRQFEATDYVEPKACKKRPKERALSKHGEIYVIVAVMDNPVHEVCAEVKDMLNVNVSPSTLCRLLKSYGITKRKYVKSLFSAVMN